MNLNLLLEASLKNIYQGFKKDSKEDADIDARYFKKYRVINVNKLDKRSNNIPLDGYSLNYDDTTKQIVIIGKVSSSDSRSTEGFYKPIFSLTTSNIKKKEDINYKNLFTKEESHVTCTCDSFKYQMSKGNKDRKSLYVGKYNNNDELNYVTTDKTWSPNPKKKGLLCKHLLVLLKDIQKNWESWKVKIDSLLEEEEFFTVKKDPTEVPKDDYEEYEDDEGFDKRMDDYSKDDVEVEPSTKKKNDYDLDNSSDVRKGTNTEPSPKKKENFIKKAYRSAKDKLSKAKGKIGKFFSKDDEQTPEDIEAPEAPEVKPSPSPEPSPVDPEEAPEATEATEEEPDELLEEGTNGFDSYFSKYSLLEINEKSVEEIVEEFINYKKGI